MVSDKQWLVLKVIDSVDAGSRIIETGLRISDTVLIPEMITEW